MAEGPPHMDYLGSSFWVSAHSRETTLDCGTLQEVTREAATLQRHHGIDNYSNSSISYDKSVAQRHTIQVHSHPIDPSVSASASASLEADNVIALPMSSSTGGSQELGNTELLTQSLTSADQDTMVRDVCTHPTILLPTSTPASAEDSNCLIFGGLAQRYKTSSFFVH
ncbi:hypothetical protein CYMTET_45016 [Cymbomonas tetramitiformis]|uniref:Uncharacterized protein n=1 Tax=Cymbomonas tetramitiformis TaxID=36881 RepID=A0AAE0BZ25_9CHLO|nr:hypothetical protein CYMTET_45016 [Cymbomonas tetramitiformis]